MPLEIEYVDSAVIPQEGRGYVYLKLEHPLVSWETAIGCFYSAEVDSYLDNIKRPSFWLANAIYYKDSKRVANEIIIESVRRGKYPHKKSRLEGIYFFGDLDSAKKGLSWGGHFQVDNLSEVFYHTKHEVTKCDANWITFAEHDANGTIKWDYYDSLLKYWAGEPCPKCDFPVWEYIIDGVLSILSPKIKTKAYELTIKNFPKSKNFLHFAMAAPHYELNVGHIVPFIEKKPNNECQLAYIIKIKDEDIATIKHGNKAQQLGIPIFQDVPLVTPDLTPYNQSFRISEKTLSEWQIRCLSIHF
ncbi:hypothetical protein COT42_03945 [Candidatus Saganbacteria bacterium CG08_land_8_20_14_0_20_45_16]|uniref:Uncharacterized protein n=1 Tax=Candidatus Saganbacteria bacterium CG08_land_8_20_14_0_20_45_16 TaxID=2014293 RepID=A0A2H0XYG3_UNCSA|nr:MAG: hypothetical protein COT42_03945 [Candidatus Saganbacteria bacterium CG08_land_8_20_14_0_20_45_16]